MIDPSAQIHRLALVEDSEIGPRSRVWQFASVIRGTVLGADCNVASCATLDGPVFGDRCIISQGAAMGPGFRFGSDIFVGPNVTICNDRWPRVSKSGFDAEAFRRGDFTVVVKDGATIGANAVVLPGVIIGKRVMVAAGAVVDRDIPDDHLFRRDGRITPFNPRRSPQRMRIVLMRQEVA
ncbi:N-acetylglucosamine-1-phosphate uridylyltransferase/acetyltransferase [Bradyrhizobium sp. YR681]|uniref:DapH/DapD/GlmU-related protein n=1 Tax=Bradyrhizobium sp. YR681 TaxID=1144344 RepID=UPI0002710D41|nr:DapH/DapD/GlmU-related protein [Bradyrhizobium sp. YR681]EJN11845.1 N-acetylglucosamine-1-phosphate uridylyltransferase/acetyltransferase [Bradyrhizobium sp. YR681]